MGSKRQEERLGTMPLGKLMFQMAVPAVAAQLINVLYNIVDRIFIGHIEGYGHLALTGVGVTFPIITLIAAFSAFAGMGGAPLASICLGERNRDGAEQIMGNCAALLALSAVLLTTGFMVFKVPVLYAFGTSDEIIGYANDYISVYLLGTVFVLFAVGMNTFISGQGNARTAMCSVMIGAVLNIVLDPIFIFVFHMGVKGAAWASVISQAVSAVWVISFLLSKKSVIRLKKKTIRLEKAVIAKISALGVSPFIMQSTESLVAVTLNAGLQKYGGDLYVGSMSILMSVIQIVYVPTQGIAQGVQPVMSYNYGAGDMKRVKGAFKGMVVTCLAASLLAGGIAIFAPGIYVDLFTNSPELTTLTKSVMPVYFIGMSIFGIQQACQGAFLALGQAKVSVFIALLRKVILLVPMAVILPRFIGVMGIYYAEPIADVISVCTTIVVFTVTFKKVLHKQR